MRAITSQHNSRKKKIFKKFLSSPYHKLFYCEIIQISSHTQMAKKFKYLFIASFGHSSCKINIYSPNFFFHLFARTVKVELNEWKSASERSEVGGLTKARCCRCWCWDWWRDFNAGRVEKWATVKHSRAFCESFNELWEVGAFYAVFGIETWNQQFVMFLIFFVKIKKNLVKSF